MFRGINAVSLDAKGRLAVPTKYRVQLLEEAGGNLIITIDTEESCLLLYPLSAWKLIEQKIEALSSFNRATRRIQRLLIGHATEVDLDSNGRILVPPLLRDYASLQKRAVLIGQGKKIEIWNEEQWNSSRETWLTENFKDENVMPEQLQDLSL